MRCAESPASSNVSVVPFPRLEGVRVPVPPSVFMMINFSCPSAPSARVKASVPVVTNHVIAVVISTAPAPVSV